MVVVGVSLLGLLAAASAFGANSPAHPLVPGSVVLAQTTYPAAGDPAIQVGQPLANGSDAIADGRYPEVFNNASVDGNFAVSTPFSLVDVDSSGNQLLQVKVPSDEVTTSFSSKSEGAINFSTDGQDLSFLAYNAPPNTLDSSNSSTPLAVDPTDPDKAGPFNRVAADLDSNGNWTFTDSNAFSGDNGRAVVLNNSNDTFYAAGNSNSGTGTDPLITHTGGAQWFAQSFDTQSGQGNGAPVGRLGTFTFNSGDKPGKDTNFRGLTIFDNVVYMTKGSGSNGTNSVYFIDTTGTACPVAPSLVDGPIDGVGVPGQNVSLPDPNHAPYPMCVLRGFNNLSAKGKNAPNVFPFGIWFANADTLYVADEGTGSATYDQDTGVYTDAAAETGAGLQKWTFDGTKWNPVYTLQSGLGLGRPYTVPGYPKGTNTVGTPPVTLPWAPATDGLRNISGHLNGDGTATIYAATSTVSGSGDQGADPNEVVAITDNIAATSATVGEKFTTIAAPQNRVIYRGVAVVPDNYGS
jgi:hypothetical protein